MSGRLIDVYRIRDGIRGLFPVSIFQFATKPGGIKPVFTLIMPQPYRAPATTEIVAMGAGKLEGVATLSGAPGLVRVLALSQSTLWKKQDAWSDPVTGKWRIWPVPLGVPLTVLGIDVKDRYNHVIAAGVLPVPSDGTD
jgi:hypothetical protein